MGLQTYSGGQPMRVWRNLRRLTERGLFLGVFLTLSTSKAEENGAVHSYPACEHEPTDNDVSAAKGAYKAGQVSFQEADYDRALLYWEDAFRRDCTAIKLLLNIARAYELSGDRPSAVRALETYLERDPEAADRASVEKRIAKLREKIEEESAEAVATAPAPPEPSQPTAPEVATPASRPKPAWPVVLTASGVAGIAVGTTVGILGAIDVGQEKDAIAQENFIIDADGNELRCDRDGRQWTNCPPSVLEDVQNDLNTSDELKRAKTMRTLGIVVGAGGAVLAGVGGYFWYKLWKAPKESAALDEPSLPLLSPVVSPHFAGFSLSGEF